MAKNKSNEVAENLDDTVESIIETTAETPTETNSQPAQTIVKKSGTGLSLLAIFIALGVGGAGYYLGQQQVGEIQQKLTALEGKITNVSSTPLDSVQPEQIETLEKNISATQNKLNQVEQLVLVKDQELGALRHQLEVVSKQAVAQQPNDWLFSEADFLLNNALRKLVLDNDVETGISLLKLANETLMKVNSSESIAIRAAINQDLKQLLSVDNVDQNSVMQQLSQLANSVDELPLLNVNFGDVSDSTKLSDSLDDWQANAEKSAVSFLNHFIRITPKQGADKKELLAPNQDIYLRENIRLRLQLAIMAVSRQQNDLYKQSLDAVATWVRSYFDTNTEVTQNFLKSTDELMELSVYVDVPNQLQSLNLLDKYLNRTPMDVKKIEIEAEKSFDEPTKSNDVKEGQANQDVSSADEKPTTEPQQ
ncbi:HemX protein [Rodentibacter caecimuris]|uniref:HemX protein n=1 Tax=Rodentibacter caecimuris TaxID=1796644 RepID=A0A9X8YX21_9PAST|nr:MULTISPECIES: uroporphyrinogen-III C-methyltransferase [Pasteurellaceae]AOF53255.1 Uroporphyrinogen-III methyltransferase [Pasteurellaceae bacterium NI1060]MCQ9123929.1 uroporphyrinogen-III C-methyltransferase [Rodentibacter heylii]MCR1838395.1 uroporphyrinogen-III C-methyltransferase [Pasteurella caecimuris]MCU0107688.1 uroporphyrinogen-III C-methyltransferase [Pasteurella caecimuris]OOF71583.1 HemX protein [Rodentibacter heylii]